MDLTKIYIDFTEMPLLLQCNMQTATPKRVKARKVDGGFSMNVNQATYEYSSVEVAVLSMYCLSINISIHFLMIDTEGANRALL